MSNIVRYDAQEDLWGRFVSHADLGLSKNIQKHDANLVERIGNAILWTAEDLPGIVWDKLKKPRAVTIALTALALVANSFLFYPVKTLKNLKAFYHWLPLPPAWAVRLSAYIFTSTMIVGYGLRAYGRFSNQELMNNFYHNHKFSLQA